MVQASFRNFIGIAFDERLEPQLGARDVDVLSYGAVYVVERTCIGARRAWAFPAQLCHQRRCGVCLVSAEFVQAVTRHQKHHQVRHDVAGQLVLQGVRCLRVGEQIWASEEEHHMNGLVCLTQFDFKIHEIEHVSSPECRW
ncbi:hypothetical protein D9M70_591800 [compost metagenome]